LFGRVLELFCLEGFIRRRNGTKIYCKIARLTTTDQKLIEGFLHLNKRIPPKPFDAGQAILDAASNSIANALDAQEAANFLAAQEAASF
jgi:hypothetical protein